MHRGNSDRWRAGLEIKRRWHDSDAIQLFVSTSNKTFTGGASPYVGIGDLADRATILEGFPKNSADVRELEFGASGAGFAGGYVRLRFSCRDIAAHAIIEIHVESKNEAKPDAPWNDGCETANFFAAVDPSAIDDFVKELRQINDDENGSAWLSFCLTPLTRAKRG
jgi:hypothetical protein